uniref:Uncharacterized protein n=1 Tax=Anguilla anguilla TaxID=7936 RepID=A0A0E9XMW3_ANGAN
MFFFGFHGPLPVHALIFDIPSLLRPLANVCLSTVCDTRPGRLRV